MVDKQERPPNALEKLGFKISDAQDFMKNAGKYFKPQRRTLGDVMINPARPGMGEDEGGQ